MQISSYIEKTYNLYPCDEGFILKQSPEKFRTIRWNEIENIFSTFARTPKSFFTQHHVYKIRGHDGYTLTFSGNRKSLAKLDQTIEEQFTRRRLPMYLADYETGRALNFGPLTISVNGISVKDTMLPWEQIADVSLLKDRRLVISRVGEQQKIWLNLSAFKIPNLMIFLALVRRIRTGESIWTKDAQPLAAYGSTITLVPATRQKISSLPDEIAALAEEHQLGERRIDEKLGLSRNVSWSMIVATFIVSALFMVLFNWLFGLGQINSSGFNWVGVYKILFLLVWNANFLASLISQFRHMDRYTCTFERGLILKYGRKTPVVCRWDEIEVVWRAAFFGKYPFYQPGYYTGYTIQFSNGSRHIFSSLAINLEAFGKILKEQVTSLQLPAIITAYQASQTLPFGPLRVSQEGIAMGTRLLPWVQVKSVRLEANRLVIYDITQRRPWGKLSAAQVPNLFVLFALADYVREQAGSSKN